MSTLGVVEDIVLALNLEIGRPAVAITQVCLGPTVLLDTLALIPGLWKLKLKLLPMCNVIGDLISIRMLLLYK